MLVEVPVFKKDDNNATFLKADRLQEQLLGIQLEYEETKQSIKKNFEKMSAFPPYSRY